MKYITFNEQLTEADYILENVDKTKLWKVYQNIFNHLKYEDGDIFIFTNQIFEDGELIKYDLEDKHFKWIDKSKLTFICDRKYIEEAIINPISKLRWKPSRNEHRSSGVEIILQNNADIINGK